METLAFQGVVGLSMAMYLWLISAGLTIIFGVLGVINFAHGSLFMLGAYFAFTFYGLLGWNFGLAIAGSLAGVALVGWVMERWFLRALYGVDEAYQLYQDGTFVLDVRTPEEWNEFHAPNTTLIPLDELASRVNELPKDQPILVVCRSGNRSQSGRDILVQAGFNATSMNGGLNEWRASGHPVVVGP